VRSRSTPRAAFCLALAVLAVSVYLTVVHFTSPRTLACARDGVVSCLQVTTSAQSEIAHVPVAVLGVLWALAMTAVCSPWAWRSGRHRIDVARVTLAVTGVAFVLWLIFAELFLVRAICLWCTVVHVLVFALFILIVRDAFPHAHEERGGARP